jgi:hypothetical protein
MTTVVTVTKINKPTERLLKFSELEEGSWYEIAKYPSSPWFEGKIGIYDGFDGGSFSLMLLEDGYKISNPDFEFRPVKTLKIEYEV